MIGARRWPLRSSRPGRSPACSALGPATTGRRPAAATGQGSSAMAQTSRADGRPARGPGCRRRGTEPFDGLQLPPAVAELKEYLPVCSARDERWQGRPGSSPSWRVCSGRPRFPMVAERRKLASAWPAMASPTRWGHRNQMRRSVNQSAWPGWRGRRCRESRTGRLLAGHPASAGENRSATRGPCPGGSGSALEGKGFLSSASRGFE